MVAVSTLPIAIALFVGVGLFAALTYLLVQEDATHQIRWRPATIAPPRVSHTRVATICVVFALWSFWATARPVSGWR